MEGVEVDLESQINNSTKQEKRPNIFHQAIETTFNRVEDPRNCQTLDDVVGKRVEGGTLKARRLDWAPRKMDISRIAETIKMVQEKQSATQPLKIVDIAGHSGFLDRLILDELDQKGRPQNEIKVTVVDPDKIVTNKARGYYKGRENRLDFRTQTSQEFVKSGEQADVVICSWMRPEMDLRPDIEKLNPKAIIFVKDVPGDVGQPQSFTDSENYKQVASWLGFSGHNIDSANNGFELHADNVVLIMTRNDGGISGEQIREGLNGIQIAEENKYSWERQLPNLDVGKIHETANYDYFRPELAG